MPRRPASPRPRAGRPNRRSRSVAATVAGVLVVLGVLGASWVLGRPEGSDVRDPVELVAVESASAEKSAAVASASIEVPDLTGMPLDEARVLLTSAGLVVRVRADGEPLAAAEPQLVERQTPDHGALVGAGATVVLTARPQTSVEATAAPSANKRRFVVCIDPGHQSSADESPEPIGPKSKVTKPKISAGVTGAKTGMPEYEIALQISMNLKSQLEQRGVKVVMTRTTNDVNLSNAERARIANGAKADLFIRVHGDGSPDAKTAGIATLYPAPNKWTKPFAAKSRRAASSVHRAVVASTGAPDRGVKALADQSGFNWSRVPVLLVECGFLSNEVEDRLLASPHYQDRIAVGITDGALGYLEAEVAR